MAEAWENGASLERSVFLVLCVLVWLNAGWQAMPLWSVAQVSKTRYR